MFKVCKIKQWQFGVFSLCVKIKGKIVKWSVNWFTNRRVGGGLKLEQIQ